MGYRGHEPTYKVPLTFQVSRHHAGRSEGVKLRAMLRVKGVNFNFESTSIFSFIYEQKPKNK